MSLLRCVPLVGVSVGLALAADAAQRPSPVPSPSAPSAVGRESQPTSPSGPFSRLFKAPSIQTPSPSTPNSAQRPSSATSQDRLPKPGVPYKACGTTVVPVDPTFDAPIRRPAPKKPTPASKGVPVTPCGR